MKIGTLCYIENNNKILMLNRIKKPNDMHKNKWVGLGGKLIPGETPEECITREIKEESGLHIIDPLIKGIITFPKFDDINDWLIFVYYCNKFKGEMIESNEGKLEWIENNKIINLNLWDGDKLFLKWLKNKPFFSAKFIYKNKKLIKHSVLFY